MNDIVPELLRVIEKDYEEGIKNSQTLKQIKEKIKDKTATYLDADDYAKEVAAVLANAYKNITADKLPNGIMYYNIASRIIEPTMQAAHDEVAKATAEIQKVLNKEAGIGIKPIKPELDKEKLNKFINKIVSEGEYGE